MLASQAATTHHAPNLAGTDISDALLPLELLELELSLDGYRGGEAGFCEAVRRTAIEAGGELLFDLPAAGLVEDCRRIAVLRVPMDGDDMHTVLALLNDSGTEIRMQRPEDESAHLAEFADAFIDVLKRI